VSIYLLDTTLGSKRPRSPLKQKSENLESQSASLEKEKGPAGEQGHFSDRLRSGGELLPPDVSHYLLK